MQQCWRTYRRVGDGGSHSGAIRQGGEAAEDQVMSAKGVLGVLAFLVRSGVFAFSLHILDDIIYPKGY